MKSPMLALYTFGQFIRPSEHTANQGFHDRNNPALAAVDLAEGMLGRSGYDGDPGPECWGTQVYPRFFLDEAGDGWAPSTLSLWQDLEAIMAYTYSGLHAEALAHGREWFQKGAWPPLVLWWTDCRPDWREAVRRFEILHDHGPGLQAFDFKQAYGPDGARMTPDRARIREIALRNKTRLENQQ